MEKLTYTHSFRGLLAYKLARELSLLVFERTKKFPKEEAYALTDQIRRSSRSIGANIAEAWAKRRYEKHFISKLTDADGEQQETQHWIETAVDCHYLTPAEANQLLSHCQRIGQLIGGMISKADQFCNPENYLRESPAEYFTENEA
ncbi:MAG: four helix bundle protein [Chloroflexi bacterium]|nr:four helix bundle protein [Chloroflexota bacterium]